MVKEPAFLKATVQVTDAALIQPLSQELLYAMDVAIKKKKINKESEIWKGRDGLGVGIGRYTLLCME